MVHCFTEIELVLCGDEYIFHHIYREELSHFIEYRHYSFIIELLWPSSKLIGPEVPHNIILNVLDHHISKIFVRKCTNNIEHRGIRYIEESEEEHTEYVFELGVPIRSKEFFEYINKSLCKYLFWFSISYCQWIETKRKFFIGWIKYDDIVFPVFWNVHHNLIDEIPMRIYNSKAFSIIDIIDHLSNEEFALSDSSLPNDIHMSQSIFVKYSYRYTDTSIIWLCKYCERSIMFCDINLTIHYGIWEYRHSDRQCKLLGIDF